MDKSEPTLVPQWLRNSGSVTGGGTRIHPLTSSQSCLDDYASSKFARKRSSVNSNNHNLGRSSVSDRKTSSYFRRSSSTNGSATLWTSGSFSRNHRERNKDNDIYGPHNKDKPIVDSYRWRELSDSSSRIDREGLRRSQSMISNKRGETWPKKLENASGSSYRKNISDCNRLPDEGILHRAAFERDFPSLGAEEKLAASEIGRLPSPGLSSAINILPVCNSAIIGSDKWTSALIEVPATVESNISSISSGKTTAAPGTASATLNPSIGLNMAETVAQGPSRVQTTPQLSTETQRQELAIKQSRQLIPVTPSLPKALVLNPPDKMKVKVGRLQPLHSPHGGLVKPDLSRSSSMGKLQILKPSRQRNDVSPASKDSLSPTSSNKLEKSELVAAPLVAGSATARRPTYISGLPSADQKPVLPLLEKKSVSQGQSRNDFFNLMRKKTTANRSSVPQTPVASLSAVHKSGEVGAASPVTHRDGDHMVSDISNGDGAPESRSDRNGNVDSCNGLEHLSNGKNSSSYDSHFLSEEEKAGLSVAQGQSRNDFFNLMRKKSLANCSSVPETPVASLSAIDKSSEVGATCPPSHHNGDYMVSDILNGNATPENRSDRNGNVDSCNGLEYLSNGKNSSSYDSHFFSEEEEAAFLRSLGWEENSDEGGLTEEEISAFYRDVTKYINSKPSLKILQGGMQPRFLLALDSHIGSIAGVSRALNSSSSKVES